MQQTLDFREPTLPADFHWLNPPLRHRQGNGLELVTDKATDFWKRTHYGFRRDNGHALLTLLSGNFHITTRVEFQPQAQYDQCGLMARLDAENWIKFSTEFEDAQHSRLGSVVTNLGYSDWATQDVSSAQRERWYRVTRDGGDFLLEHSDDGRGWHQQRIAHLHRATNSLEAGVYACSPIGEAFWCRFHFLEIGESGGHVGGRATSP